MSDLNTNNFIKAEQLLKKILSKNNTAEFNYILGNTFKPFKSVFKYIPVPPTIIGNKFFF